MTHDSDRIAAHFRRRERAPSRRSGVRGDPERAKALGIHGGSAFRAIAGFGRHGSLRAEGFFEIAANLPVQVEFIVGEEQAQQLLNLLRAEKLSLPYTLSAVQFGFTAAASA